MFNSLYNITYEYVKDAVVCVGLWLVEKPSSVLSVLTGVWSGVGAFLPASGPAVILQEMFVCIFSALLSLPREAAYRSLHPGVEKEEIGMGW